jgi:predicted acylesterase/phospholipase RssA
MLRKYLKDIRLEQLPVPIRAITLDLIGGRPVVRNHGDAVHAILESINLPVLSIPICREGRALVDGGLVNNVPANVLVDEGCNFVIAVSVTARLESRFGGNRPDMGTEQMKPPSTLQTALRSHMVQSMNMNSIGVQPADIVIEPDVTEFDLAEFTRTDELAAAGEKATLEAIPRIREMLAKLDGELFSSGA